MKRFLVWKLLPVLIGLVAIAAAILAIARNWSALHDALGRIGVAAPVVALMFGVAGVFLPFLAWREVLVGLGASAPRSMSARLFFTSQLGKYLPGSVWPVVAQMEFGRRAGVNRRTMLAANVITLTAIIAVGLVVAGVCLPLSSSAALHRFWWIFLLLPVLVGLLHPRAIPAALDTAFRLVRRQPLDERLPLRGSVRASAWGLVSWLAFGAHVFALTHALGAHGPSAMLAALGGQALAVSAGIVFVPAPAGAGVRDVVLIATLTPSVGATNALAVALVSRALLIVADLLLAATFGVRGRADSDPHPSTVGVGASPAPRDAD